MLATARALMFEAKLLAIDEPSLGLAPRIREELFAAIGKIHAEGVPVLLVEQEVGQVFRMAKRSYVLSQGRIIAEGSAQSLMADETLRAGYLAVASVQTAAPHSRQIALPARRCAACSAGTGSRSCRAPTASGRAA